MSASLAKRERMTVEQYLDWAKGQPKGRYELIDGVPFRMSPERNLHALVKGSTYLAFYEAVQARGSEFVAFVDGPTIPTGKRQAREPDVVIHPREGISWDALSLDRPVILVEVTSPSTARTDAKDKLQEYFNVPSVSHYLIVDPDRRVVDHYRRGATGDIESTTLTHGTASFEPTGLVVEIARFFQGLPPGGETA